MQSVLASSLNIGLVSISSYFRYTGCCYYFPFQVSLQRGGLPLSNVGILYIHFTQMKVAKSQE